MAFLVCMTVSIATNFSFVLIDFTDELAHDFDKNISLNYFIFSQDFHKNTTVIMTA